MKLPARRVADANSLSFPRYADVAHTRWLFEPLPEGFIIGRRLDDNKGPFVGDHVTTSGQAKEKDRCQEGSTFHRARFLCGRTSDYAALSARQQSASAR